MARVVLISGKQGSGKTTLANMMTNLAYRNGRRAVILNYADPLYAMHNFIRFQMNELGMIHPANKAVKDGELLQYLGTDWGRKNYGQDVWVRAMKARVDTHSHFDYIFISDVRFKNEFDAFPTATSIRLICPEDIRKSRAENWRENTDHPSETDLDIYEERGLFSMTYHTSLTTAMSLAEHIFGRLMEAEQALPALEN